MKKLIFLASLCIIFAMQSCSSDEEPKLPEVEQAEKVITHMMIKFEGRTYETDAMEVGDSVVYLNKEYDEIYRTKIATNPDIAAIYNSNDPETTYVEYFPSEKALREKYDFIQFDNKSKDLDTELATRGGEIDLWNPNFPSTVLALAELYDDRNFKDTKLISYATCHWCTTMPRLKDKGFNDKTSSIKVYNKMDPTKLYKIYIPDFKPADSTPLPLLGGYPGASLRPVLACYHNSNLSGSVIYCVAPPAGSTDPHADNNLKNIGWNDRISSITWYICTDSKQFTGDKAICPPHPDC